MAARFACINGQMWKIPGCATGRRPLASTRFERPLTGQSWEETMRMTWAAAIAAGAMTLAASFAQAEPANTECLVGAKPGGGFDLTCRLLATSLQNAKLVAAPMAVNYMEGGVGAVAYNHVIGTRPGDAGLVVAVSSGSALLLAQKKFGEHDENAVRWIGALGAEYGSIAVAADSPYKSLQDLMAAIKADPTIAVGGGGAVGSQDWMKAALVMKAAGVDSKAMRYVALEGGGAVLTQLQGGHIKIGSSDAAEFAPHHKAGKLRILAVMAPNRLGGDLADVPTAKEQGVDVVWTVWRGVYGGPKMSDADYKWWTDTLKKLADTPEFKTEQAARGLAPLPLYGEDFSKQVKADVARFKDLAKEAGLIK
jgi:putative tricarboxylic transport membrane protein